MLQGQRVSAESQFALGIWSLFLRPIALDSQSTLLVLHQECKQVDFLRLFVVIEVFVDDIGMAVNQLLIQPQSHQSTTHSRVSYSMGETVRRARSRRGKLVQREVRGLAASVVLVSSVPGPWVVVRLFLLSWCLSLVPGSLSHFCSLYFSGLVWANLQALWCADEPRTHRRFGVRTAFVES